MPSSPASPAAPSRSPRCADRRLFNPPSPRYTPPRLPSPGRRERGEAPIADRVDLAKAAAFRIGRLGIHPATREIVRDDGAREVVEPRVMQVLVMLARAESAIVSRDELTEGCWEGRIVGEDAINRVISRLRKVAEGIGAGSFRIETVTKVGYRLARPGDPPAAEAAIAGIRRRPSRRLVLAGGAAIAGTAAAGFWLWPRPRPSGPPDEVAPLMAQAGVALRQGTVEGNNQALGLLRQVVALRPDYADGWGALALGYAYAFYGRGARNDPSAALRARAAVARATELDPHNPYAMAALATLQPQMGTWRQREAILRSGLPAHADNDILLQQLGFLLGQVGRCREGAALLDRAVRLPPPTPTVLYTHIVMLWGAGRLEEVDQALERALALFPSHFALWFARFYTFLFTGRAAQAAQWCENVQGRPTGIPESEFAIIQAVAGAMISRRPAEIERALAASFAAAHHGSGHAENCIQHACAFGRLDLAFAVAEALYFGRGFDPGEIRFNVEAATYTRYSDRRTYFLFLPHMAPMRADPRFAALTGRLGLDLYWSESGVGPDFRR